MLAQYSSQSLTVYRLNHEAFTNNGQIVYQSVQTISSYAGNKLDCVDVDV